MDLTEKERAVLKALYIREQAEDGKRIYLIEAIDLGSKYFIINGYGDIKYDPETILSLKQKGLLCSDGPRYRLSDIGRYKAEKIYREELL